MTGEPFTYWLLCFVALLIAFAVMGAIGNYAGKIANAMLGDKDARPYVARRGRIDL
jgi:hypothetical protein